MNTSTPQPTPSTRAPRQNVSSHAVHGITVNDHCRGLLLREQHWNKAGHVRKVTERGGREEDGAGERVPEELYVRRVLQKMHREKNVQNVTKTHWGKQPARRRTLASLLTLSIAWATAAHRCFHTGNNGYEIVA